MKIIENLIGDLSHHIGDKCTLTIEQNKNTPYIITDPIEGLFNGFIGNTLLKVRTKSGEFLVDVSKCKLTTDSDTFYFEGPSGTVAIDFE